MIILLVQGLNEKKVVDERLWYYHEYIAPLLFEDRQLERVELPLSVSILLFSVELHQLRFSEHKWRTPNPLATEIPATATLKPKKNKTLNKLADLVLPPPPATIDTMSAPTAPLLPHLATK